MSTEQFGSYISLATFKRDGSEVRTPVWYATSGGKMYVFTEGEAYKVKRLRKNDRIRVAACGVAGRILGPWHEGRGRIIEDEATEKRAYAALHAKYGWQMKIVDLLSTLAGRIGARSILELELDDPNSRG